MENKISQLIKLVQKLPEECLDDAIDYLSNKIEKNAENRPVPACPHCKTESVTRFGHKGKQQRYRCKDCGKTFVENTNTVMYQSHCGEAVWKQVIRDTVSGVPIDDTAVSIGVSHSTAFQMRHKILLSLESEETREPTVLDGVCELDDTYVLESYKGIKLSEGFWREARKHGAVAQKRGISNEYICISTGVQRDGAAYSQSVTRATPSKDDIKSVFEGHIRNSSLIICDGATSYNALGESCGCPVMNVDEEKGFTHVNTANSFHSFIKGRYNQYRGVATKYLNRYNILFSKAFRNSDDLVSELYNILISNDTPRHHSVHDVKTLNLLDI